MTGWMLSDGADGEFGSVAAPWRSVRDEQHLREQLAGLAAKGPRLLKLLSPRRAALYLGLGGLRGLRPARLTLSAAAQIKSRTRGRT